MEAVEEQVGSPSTVTAGSASSGFDTELSATPGINSLGVAAKVGIAAGRLKRNSVRFKDDAAVGSNGESSFSTGTRRPLGAPSSSESTESSSPQRSAVKPLLKPGGSLKRASTISNLSFLARRNSSEISANNTLAYDTHSWIASFRVLGKGLLQDHFLLRPWFFLTLYALLVAILAKAAVFEDPATLSFSADVPLGVAGSMALMLTFRLNVCYNRWWEGRELWQVH